MGNLPEIGDHFSALLTGSPKNVATPLSVCERGRRVAGPVSIPKPAGRIPVPQPRPHAAAVPMRTMDAINDRHGRAVRLASTARVTGICAESDYATVHKGSRLGVEGGGSATFI
jgi:hypothetical protein